MILSHELFKKIDGRSTEMAIHFDSGKVSATLVYLDGEEKAKVLSHITKEIRSMETHTNDELFEVAFGFLEEVLDEIVLVSQKLFQIDDLLKDHQKIQRIHFFVGQPFSKTQLHVKQHNNVQGEVITRDLLNALVNKAIPQGTDRIGTIISSVHANGYHTQTEAVTGSTVQELELSFLDVHMRFDFMETLYQLLISKFNVSNDEIDFISIEGPLVGEFQSQYNPNGSYATAYIQGSTTEVSVYNNNRHIGMNVITSGCNTMQKNAINSEVVSTPDQYKSIVRAYNRGHLDEVNTKIMENVLQKEYDILRNQISEMSLEMGVIVPHDLYIIADREIVKALTKKINSTKTMRAVHVTIDTHFVVEDQVDIDNSTKACLNYISRTN